MRDIPAKATNSAFVWSSGTLTLVPYGDTDITANGYTYTAPSSPLYDLTDDDFLSMHASRYRHAQPICAPGHLEHLPPVALPVHGLWVADTSYYYPEDRGISESIEFGRAMARQVAT